MCDVTLMKQRRMYLSKCFLDSAPTNAVTGMAASFWSGREQETTVKQEGRPCAKGYMCSHVFLPFLESSTSQTCSRMRRRRRRRSDGTGPVLRRTQTDAPGSLDQETRLSRFL